MTPANTINFRQSILNCLGEFPEKPAPDFKIDSSEQKPGYIRHKVSYNVEAGERVNAILLTPEKTTVKSPAILALHQHNGQWDLGKSEVEGTAGEPMYAYGLDLCLRGYVVLCPDHLAFEERIPDYFRKEPGNLQGYERFAFCKYVQDGKCLQTKYIHDLSVALDILEQLNSVDSSRIGVIGHSLGGQETLWITWYDDRVKAAVSSCGFGKISTIFRDYVLHNFAMYIPGMAAIGDIDDLVQDIAPHPFAMTSGTEDIIFPIDGVREIVEKAEKTYRAKGKAENFLPVIFDAGHSFPDDVKTRVYNWLDAILKK